MLIGLLAVTTLALGYAWFILPNQLSRRARASFIAVLEKRFDATVELRRFDIRFLPVASVVGEGLVLRYQGRTDIPPIISVERFAAGASWSDLFATPVRVRKVAVDGLRLHIPSRATGGRLVLDKDDDRKAAPKGGPRAKPEAQAGPPATDTTERPSPVLIDKIVSTGATLEIASGKPNRPPRVFDIHTLTLVDVALDRPMKFEAVLTNPKPPGEINTHGQFGPWHREGPSLTPVSGEYTFDNADLGVFGGISGRLSSRGAYSGVLERILVEGDTDTPDFSVTRTGLTVPLKTRFNAVVDGTSGDTILERVDATFLDSSLTARGGVVRTEGVKGRTVTLDVTMKQARMENVLRFAVKATQPPMTGALDLNTTLRLPPGEPDVPDRLELDGTFALRSARFGDPKVQGKITSFSRLGRGERGEPERDERVLSDLKGRFTMKGGAIRFASLTFGVPGADVRLAGTYRLEGEQLDFAGSVRLQATVSQMTTGVKSVFLKIIDPLFKRADAGTVLPVRITGTREKPDFRVEVMKAITRRK